MAKPIRMLAAAAGLAARAPFAAARRGLVAVTTSGSCTVLALLGWASSTGAVAGPASVTFDASPSYIAPANSFTSSDLATVWVARRGGVSTVAPRPDGSAFVRAELTLGPDVEPVAVGPLSGGIAVLDRASASLRVFTGSTRRDRLVGSWSVGAAPSGMVIADFNGDSRDDVAVTNSLSDDVSVRLGRSDLQLGPEQRFAVGARPVAIELADLGGTHSDLVVADGGATTVTVLSGDGKGGFPLRLDVDVGAQPRSMGVAGDYLGDDGQIGQRWWWASVAAAWRCSPAALSRRSGTSRFPPG